jgi:hypothetical protein
MRRLNHPFYFRSIDRRALRVAAAKSAPRGRNRFGSAGYEDGAGAKARAFALGGQS